MILGYAIVDKDGRNFWSDVPLFRDRDFAMQTCADLDASRQDQGPFRVINLYSDESPAIRMIADERQRQIDEEGWTPEHDDHHEDPELLYAAEAYMFGDPDAWPWEEDSYKPTSKVRDLARAGALIAAEIDRLLRQGQIA